MRAAWQRKCLERHLCRCKQASPRESQELCEAAIRSARVALLTACYRNIRQFSDPEFPLDRFHHIEDMRSSESLSRLKEDSTGGVSFDVVLLQNSLHFFTHETRPILLKRLLTLPSPGGRIVVDWPLPSSSHRHIRGTKSFNDSMCTLFGYQQILTPQGWNDLKTGS
jgi:hypothetical protein